MGQLFEMGMLLAFGAAWPLNIRKSFVSRTARGTSPGFLIVVIIGYISGILSKFVSQSITYVLFFYLLNLLMVTVNLILYFRNRKIDKRTEDQTDIPIDRAAVAK